MIVWASISPTVWSLVVGGNELAKGEGRSKKNAEQRAAKEAYLSAISEADEVD